MLQPIIYNPLVGKRSGTSTLAGLGCACGLGNTGESGELSEAQSKFLGAARGVGLGLGIAASVMILTGLVRCRTK